MIAITKNLETDVLIVGGGIAGLNAAIAAREGGAEVIVAEKANTLRSGSGATGNDHFLCYIPEKHGPDPHVVLNEIRNSMVWQGQDVPLTMRFLEESFSVVQRWHSWGINMRLFNDWTFLGHAFPGRPRIFLKFEGQNQKPILTREAKKAGAKILNHHVVLDLIKNDTGIAGALAMDVSGKEPTFTIIRAKCVMLAAGCGNRLYTSANTPGSMFNTGLCPSCTAAAPAQAWRIGATLVNMETPVRVAGSKYFTRCGKATWIGVYRYPDGRPLGPFVTKPTRELGDITGDIWNLAFTELMQNGNGPVYMDCSQTSKEDLTFMRSAMASEGLTSLVNYMDEHGIDPSKSGVEFAQLETQLMGCNGIQIDINGESSIPGLYAAGDCTGNFRADIAGAAVYGWIGGRHAATQVHNRVLMSAERAENDSWVKNRIAYYSSFYDRKEGAGWIEANKGVQQIMSDYAPAGPTKVRSESLLRAGLDYLAKLRTYTEAELSAPDAHTLMRSVEVFDLMDCAAIVMRAARERKETRGLHRRSDYTFTNPLLNDKLQTIRQENGEVISEWRTRLEA